MISHLSLLLAFQPSLLCEIKEKEINESSGLASSRAADKVWYTHNDSGDKPRFFRFDETGRITATFSLKGAKALDWEDMAAARVKGTNWIYLGDIGDNGRIRKTITVYRVKEPKADQRSRDLAKFDEWTIKYSDAPHDCEALMVHPKTGDIWLVTKDRGEGTLVFVVRKPKGRDVLAAQRMGSLKIPFTGLGAGMVTGGDISPDGGHIALRTYAGVLEFKAGDKFDEWFKGTGRVLSPANEQQGEALAYSRDGSRLATTSEGSPCRVSLVGRPK